MSALDSTQEELFSASPTRSSNRLHVLRLTEVVRHGIRPNADDGNMEVPDPLDGELKQQAVEYVIKCFPATFGKRLRAAADTWLSLS
jgi:hypothetical protein